MADKDIAPFKDRVAFITGASRGIGKAIALALAERGCHVVVTGKTVEPHEKLPGTIEETARAVQALGVVGLPLQLDVRNAAAITNAAVIAHERLGRLDFVIHNAGALFWRPLAETPIGKFDLVMGANARAAFALAHATVPYMVKRGFGHFLTMSPPVRIDGAPGKIAYAISKYGMTLVAQGLAEELAGTGVAANALWPATMIETAAVSVNGLGDKSLWRTPQIVVDATLAILAKDPAEYTGRAVVDEDVLRGEGVTDFTKYRCDPAHEPPHIPFSFKVRR